MTEQYYAALPKFHTTYANIIKSLLPIVSDKPKSKKNQLPDVTYHVENLVIDKAHLKNYCGICGFDKDGSVPITYFAVLSQSLQMNMMVKEAFPFAMLGLVHIENTTTQYRRIYDNESLSLSVQLSNLREHEKGQQFDFLTQVKSADKVVWEGVTTYLSRGRKKAAANKSKPTSSKMVSSDALVHNIFSVPENIGRRYAMISGDFNLIHLHPLSAKVFGFPTTIAHGMWSKAKCISQLKNLPDAYRVDVSFKLPILLPAEVELIAKVDDTDMGNEQIFGLYNAKNDKPHLSGSVSVVEAV